jgi:hypothetical protein
LLSDLLAAAATTQYVASDAGDNGDIPTLFDTVLVAGLIISEPSSYLMLVMGTVAFIHSGKRFNRQ